MRVEAQQADMRLTDPGQAPATVAEQSLKAATIHIAKLSLSDFRSYRNLQMQTEGLPVVLSGSNGAGKTNLLEALSCFSPGRGLRRARLSEMKRHDATAAWAVSARLRGLGDDHQIGVGFDSGESSGGERRQVRIDGENASSGELRELLGVQWLTPRMDRLFVEGKGERRRFLDRLVFGSDPGHGKRVNTYEGVMRERNQLLRDKRRDDAWVGALEARMAEDAVAIAAARLATLDRLNAALAQGIGPFPSAALAIEGVVEDMLEKMPAVDAEGHFAEALRLGRFKDEAAGRALDGPHRSDLLVTYAATGLPAAQCSTGEQKALLIAIVLANARLEKVEQGQAPILLMDEVTAHLDENRRRALFDEICALSGQTWLTGTDRALFAGLDGRAHFYKVQDSALYLEE